MLLIVIPIAWLAILILFVALCQAAARGDADQAQRGGRPAVVAFGEPAIDEGGAIVQRLRWRRAAERRCRTWVARARVLDVRHLAAPRPASGEQRTVHALPRRPV